MPQGAQHSGLSGPIRNKRLDAILLAPHPSHDASGHVDCEVNSSMICFTWFVILIGNLSLASAMSIETMEGQPIAHAILIHSQEEAAEQRGYPMPLLDQPHLPSVKSPEHGQDISELHTAQHESIARGLNEQIMKRCAQLLEHQRKLDRKIEDLKKAGKKENLEELETQADKLHALTAVNCKTPQ